MARIFISYSRKDTAILNALIPQLENVYGSGSHWYDAGLSGGNEWWKSILAQIEICHVFVFLMTDNSIASKACLDEIREALRHRKPVLQVLLPSFTVAYDNSLPSDLYNELKKIQYVDLRKQFDEDQLAYRDLSKLWGALNNLLTYSRRPLSTTERLVLFNQMEILEKLHYLQQKLESSDGNDDRDNTIEESYDPKHFRTTKEILAQGYEWYYGRIVDHIYEEVFPYASGTEVIDILDMFRALKSSYKNLSDKSGIDELTITFHGFDGNHEPAEKLFTEFTIDDMRKFEELKPKTREQYNSHHPMLPTYRRMLLVWNACRDKHNLSKDEILRIANAG